MDDDLHAHRTAAIALLERLTVRGRQISERLNVTPDSGVDIRSWQQDVAVAVNELSGGSKAHWLSRAFSEAFLVRPDAGGGVVTEASAGDIVERLLGVLAQASASLASIDDATGTAAGAAPEPRRFDFVHNTALRPVLEGAYRESGRAGERGDFQSAFVTACSVLEAIITDALEHIRLEPDTPNAEHAHDDELARMSFDARVAAAERAGLIRGGCARLPAIARTYRDLAPDTSVSEREAKLVRQVLHVVMRDLDPGR